MDTDGVFSYGGKQYSVAEFEQYAGKPVSGGDTIYDMDRVNIVDKGMTLELYDQEIVFLKEIVK